MIKPIENPIAAPADAKPGEGCSHPQRTLLKNNRRASQRFTAKPGKTVFFPEGAGAIRDASIDGVFIVDSRPLVVGTQITFTFFMGNETATFRGIVRRSVAKEGMGIQFQETPRELRRRLLSNVAC
jgi:hypothetical protein